MMEISSIENSNLHIQIKNLNICTTHSKTHGKSRDFSIARINILSREFIFFNARLRRLAAASALKATSIQTFEISETCVWHLSRR